MNRLYVMSQGFDVDLKDESMLHWTLELQAPLVLFKWGNISSIEVIRSRQDSLSNGIS